MELKIGNLYANIYEGDVLNVLSGLPNESVQCCVTSPPYFGLRDYGIDGQIGRESTISEYVNKLKEVFHEVKRVLKNDGTLWLNLGDSYSGSGKGYNADGTTGAKEGSMQYTNKGTITKIDDVVKTDWEGLPSKNLCGIPWRVAFALQDDGWILRSDIIWHKPNCVPSSVKDRPTMSHEYIFLFAKSKKYYYDYESIMEDAKWERWGKQTDIKGQIGASNFLGGKEIEELPIKDKKNKRSVWTVPIHGYSDAHFATFPTKLIEPCILAGTKKNDVVLDPFNGSATTGEVSLKHYRNYIGIEINPEYIKISEKRLNNLQICEELF